MAAGPASGLLAELALVDSHCHAVLARAPDTSELDHFCTEAGGPLAAGASAWDSPAGLAIRRWCPPVLGLPALVEPADYLARRAELSHQEVTYRLLRAAGLSDLLVDTGLCGPELADPATLGRAAGARVWEVVRLERVAEQVAAAGVPPERFASSYVEQLAQACEGAVAVKSVVAYRHGLDVDPARPSSADVRAAADEWLSGPATRLDHPVLLRFVMWAGVDTGLPLQVHAGFGDRDLDLRRSDPLLLQPFLAAVDPSGVPVVLLHCYPYHRQAGWLAAVFPHVYVDVGLTVGQVGARAGAVLAEFLELAPFGKLLFSTDGYRLPELYLVGAAQFRHSFGNLLDSLVAEGALLAADATRAARMVSGENARRVYRRIDV